MPRKKEFRNGFHVKFIPEGRLKDLEQLATQFPFIQDKQIALSKYIEVFSSTVERCWNTDKEYVAISQKVMIEKLMLSNGKESKRLLDDLVEHRFLLRDKATFKIGDCSWSYKPVFDKLDTVKFFRNHLNVNTDRMLYGQRAEEVLCEDSRLYKIILMKIKVEYTIYDYISKEYGNDVSNNMCELITRNQYNTISDKMYVICNSIKYNDKRDVYDVGLVPYNNVIKINGSTDVGRIVHDGSEELKLCENTGPYEVSGRIPTKLISVYKLMSGQFRISRPIKDSRVYTNLTNLPREYRKFLRLNGKPLIGFDIANSQPLIAAVAFKRYCENWDIDLGHDVMEYQKACEKGVFYEYFMELNGVDTNCEETRSTFKGRFFGQVFYSMNYEKETDMQQQFKAKYPACYEAMYQLKGGCNYSKKYKQFPALMTEFETSIMWETNVNLIKRGYDVVNIFDSLYSDSVEAVETAKQLVTVAFAAFGITPTLKDIDYRQKAG